MRGIHVFTVTYKCGTEIDYKIGDESPIYGYTCDGRIKR